MSLLDGAQMSIKDKDLAAARNAAAQFISTPTGHVTAVAAPMLGTAAGIGLIDAQQDDISPVEAMLGMHAGVPYAAGGALAAGMAAPVIGGVIDRKGIALSEMERRVILQDLASLDAQVAAGNSAYEAYDSARAKGGDVENLRPTISPEDIKAKSKKADGIRSKQLAEVNQQLDGLHKRARGKGGALTAAGLGLLGLAAAYTNRSPDPVVTSTRSNDPFLEPHGWSAINTTERMKNWAAGREDDYDFGMPY